MRRWNALLKSLETEGGSIVILIFLLLLFCYLTTIGFTEADKHLYAFEGALLMLLRGNLSPKSHDEDKQ